MYKREVGANKNTGRKTDKINQAGSKVEGSCKRSLQSMLMGLNKVLKSRVSLSAKDICRQLEKNDNSVHRSMGIERKQQSGMLRSSNIGETLMLFFNNNTKMYLGLEVGQAQVLSVSWPHLVLVLTKPLKYLVYSHDFPPLLLAVLCQLNLSYT